MSDRVSIVYSKHYQINLGGIEKLHPFDINKYAKIYLRLQTAGYLRPADVYVPEPIAAEDIERVHTPEYLATLQQPHALARYLEFGPAKLVSADLTDVAVLAPFRHATGGTLRAARLALKYGIGINLGGGYHHAEPDRGGGFCIYADMPIAVRRLQDEGVIRRVLIVDVDVHQGNGTAACLAADPDVFTFDLFQENIYPHPKRTNDWDIPLPPGTNDHGYLAILAEHLPEAFDRARPDIVFLQAGVDVLRGDPLAGFEMTLEGVVQRDAIVFAEAARRNVPVVMVLGGGYSDQAWHVQYHSIENIIRTYGLNSSNPPYARRHPSVKEKLYVK
jgi:histone deacetylase 11